MPKLYLVGVTEDRSGIVLARSPRAKSGESVLEVDADVLDAIAEIRRYRSQGALPPPISSPALPTRHRPTGEGPSASGLSPREIQSRLRRGESIESVARRAGIEAWRIEVYAAPIAAEQARIVARARELDMDKRGAGPSGRPLGDSVQANIIEKKVSMNIDEFESAWSAYEPEPDQWVVQFRYTSRGRDQLAEWTYDPDEDAIVPANRLATTLGWRDPKRPGRLRPLPEAPRRSRDDASTKTSKKKASTKKASTKKAPAKKATTKKAPAKKTSTKKASTKKASTKKAPAKKATTKKAPAKKSSSKKSSSKKSSSKKSSSKTSGSGRGSKARTAAPKKTSSPRRTSKRTTSSPKNTSSKKTSSARKSGAKKRSSNRSGSAKSKRSKAPPAAASAPGNWREELARRVAEDRAATGGRRGAWRVLPDDSEGDAVAPDEPLDLPSWVPAARERAEAPATDSADEAELDENVDPEPSGADEAELDENVDPEPSGADPTRSHVRVMAPRVSDGKQPGGRRRRFRRARRAK